jgi:hypothetical protein
MCARIHVSRAQDPEYPPAPQLSGVVFIEDPQRGLEPRPLALVRALQRPPQIRPYRRQLVHEQPRLAS